MIFQLLIVQHFFLNSSYSPNGVEPPPRWTCLLCALGLFVYQSLDSIDGKQARRTNTSSPLGELFDHGCDSISTIFVALSACISCQLGHYPNWLFFQVNLWIFLYLQAFICCLCLSVLLCHSIILLCPLANLCIWNDALWTHRCNWGTIFDYCHTFSFSPVGTRDLADKGKPFGWITFLQIFPS